MRRDILSSDVMMTGAAAAAARGEMSDVGQEGRQYGQTKNKHKQKIGVETIFYTSTIFLQTI
jgi:hypothetical protein